MGKQRVAELQERFATQGYVEFGINPIKVGVYVVGYLTLGAILVAIGVALGPIGIALLGLFTAFLLVSAGWKLVAQVWGAGPALRIDRDGVTFRRWNGPVSLPWSDGIWLTAWSPGADGFLKHVKIQTTGSPAWAEYRSRRSNHPVLDRFARATDRSEVLLFKVFDASTKDIIALVDADFLDSIGVVAEGPRALRDYRDVPYVPDPELEATKDAILDLQRRVDAADEQARREGRKVSPEQEAAFADEAAAIALRYGQATDGSEPDR